MTKLSALFLALAFATPAFAAKNGGMTPVRTINPVAARAAIRAKVESKFGASALKGLRIYLTDNGPAADKFKALGPKEAMGMRFSAGGEVEQGPGKSKAKVVDIGLLATVTAKK